MQSSVLAPLLGLTARQIANLAREGMPHQGELYDVGACVQWYVRYKTKNDRPVNESEARARKLNADAAKAEIDLREREGELIPLALHAERVERTCLNLAAVCRGGLSRFVPEVQRADTPAQALALLERVGDTLVDALREIDVPVGDEDDGGAEAEA